MREKLFKAWDKARHRMSKSIPVYWPFLEWSDGDIEMPTDFAIMKDRCEFLDYIGLEAKGGQKIFEGDILKTLWQHDGATNVDYEMTGVVTWDNGRGQWGIYVHKGSEAGWYPLCSYEREELFVEEIELLGNVRQNPELLNL